MDTWKVPIIFMTFCTLMQANGRLSWTPEEEGMLTRDMNGPMEPSWTEPKESMMKRSKALRFYGLMGKREVTKKPFQMRRRNKGEAFVGLMGRSLSSAKLMREKIPPQSTNEIPVLEKPYKQGSLKHKAPY